jgi:hypothetical protein
MPVRMKDLFALSEAEDDTMGSLADLLELLLEAFPHGEFTVDELTKRLVAQDPLDPTTLNGRLLDAMHDVGRQPMRVVTPRAVGAVLQRNVKGVPIKRAGGRIVTVAPAQRLRNTDKILWKVAGDGFVPPASRPETKF